MPQGDREFERIETHPELRRKMYVAARELRKAGTRTEFLLWQELRAGKLHRRKFRRQQPIGPFVVDFFCASERLIVEVDGAVHRDQVEHHRARQELIESVGYRFVRVTASQVECDLPAVLDLIARAFRDSGQSIQQRPPLRRDGEGTGERSLST